MRVMWTVWWLSLALLGLGCEGSTPEDNDVSTQPSCVPNPEVWESTIKPMIEENCGSCHSEEPNFGAPFTLFDYDANVAGAEGARRVDRLVERVGNNTMPPVGLPRPPHNVRDTLVEWASCGLVHPDHSVGLEASAPVFLAEDEPPADMTDFFDLLAPDFAVSQDTLDLYQCFAFSAPVDSERFIRRIETRVDESRVLHHIVLLRDSSNATSGDSFTCFGLPFNTEYLYAWAPGGGPVQFPEGGLRIAPGDRFVIQIHYNNGAGIPDVTDNTGVRIYHGPPEGPEYGMFSPGPLAFEIPSGPDPVTVSGSCEIDSPMDVLAGMPHMHEVGESFLQEIVRTDGTREDLIALSGWSFELQHFYSTPVSLAAGDTLETHCVFRNTTGQTVISGEKTSDEMCFNFMYVTPPPADRFCDSLPISGTDPLVVDYTPGTCAPSPGVAEPGLVPGALAVGTAPSLAGGTLTDGLYELTGYEMWLDTADLGAGTLDVEKSEIALKGQLQIEAGHVALDTAATLRIVLTNGLSFDNGSTNSIGAAYAPGATADELVLTPDCGSTEPTVTARYEVVDASTVKVSFRTEGQLNFTSVLIFTLE